MIFQFQKEFMKSRLLYPSESLNPSNIINRSFKSVTRYSDPSKFIPQKISKRPKNFEFPKVKKINLPIWSPGWLRRNRKIRIKRELICDRVMTTVYLSTSSSLLSFIWKVLLESQNFLMILFQRIFQGSDCNVSLIFKSLRK